jgi:hypothetical protein
VVRGAASVATSVDMFAKFVMTNCNTQL